MLRLHYITIKHFPNMSVLYENMNVLAVSAQVVIAFIQ